MLNLLFRHTRIILFVIILLAAVLRLWNLENVPPSPSMDEASIAYNAYSLLKIGVDEYGEIPILSHRSYDDYRRAIYLYLAMPFIGLFGLDAVAIRLPAVILSILTVLATYFLVKELFSIHLGGVASQHPRGGRMVYPVRNSSGVKYVDSLALLTSFLLAISPWHIYISRLGHESNAFLSFFIFGVLFFLQAEREKNKYKIFLSLLFLALSMISYYAGQALIPLFIIGAFFIFRKTFLSMIGKDKKILIFLFATLVLFVLILRGLFSPDALIRFQGTSIFNSNPQQVHEYALRRAEAIEKGDFLKAITYDRRILMARQVLEGYFAHFRPTWLLINSGGEPHKVPNMGLLYLWDTPFIIIGVIVFLFSRTLDTKIKMFVLLWFFLAPLPASIATQAPHAIRSYTFLPTWQIFAAFGLTFVFLKLSEFKKFKFLLISIFLIYSTASLLVFYKNYFIVFPREQSKSFHYAFSNAVPYILSQQKNYKKIVFLNRNNLYQSYMVFLFHSRYDPSLYQNFGGTKSGGFAETHKFDKYEFRPVDLKNEIMEEGVLYIVNAKEAKEGQPALKTFSNLDGSEAIRILIK